MSTGRDDDALSWGGDDDPTLVSGARPSASEETPPVLPRGFTAVGKNREKVGRIDADGTVTMPGEREPMSSATLVVLGVIAGAYLLFTIGWIVGGLRLQGTAQFLVSPLGYQAAFWLAAAAPALWFATVLVLTRDTKTWMRIVWLVAGMVLLIPWPFVMVGAVGQAVTP
ncbi:MAG: DNA polymerase III subunit gamma/tau [Microbacterium sp.]|nr:MAG: DNA polymerase III subunit gamma/tau [Microbacterium sp.]